MADGTAPRTPAEITPAWLTDALRENGIVRDAAVVGVKTQGIGAGAGFLGQLAKVSLEYDRPEVGAPSSLIAKLPAVDPANREIGNLFRFYEREISFYRDLAPRLALRVPRHYYSAMNVPADDYILLMEDFAAARPGDEMTGGSPEDAESAVRSIADLHAAWWTNDEADRFEWLPLVNAPVHQSAEHSYRQAWGPFVEMFGDMMSPKMLQIGEEMQTKIIDLLNHFERPPRTIIHGDYRLDNMFFDHPDGSDVAVIDWQISSRGRGIFDVAYFMSTCMEPGDRRAHEMRLVRLWHDIVVDAGAKGYSFDDAVTDYRTAVLYAHTYTVIALGSMDAANERGVAMFKKWLTRRTSALLDLDAYELMPK